MARLNITLPEALYARLEQLRDRINLSKVCATALEKEVIMLEGQPTITDPRIARLIQRLQSTRERWHQRGYEDGVQWAVDLATRDELQSVATHLADHRACPLLRRDEGGHRLSHGLRNEMHIPSEMALERALLHSSYVQRGGTSLTLKAEETM